MLYLIALICPPLAILCVGRFLGAIGCFLLSVVGIVLLPFVVGVVPLLMCYVWAWHDVKMYHRGVGSGTVQVVVQNYVPRQE